MYALNIYIFHTVNTYNYNHFSLVDKRLPRYDMFCEKYVYFKYTYLKLHVIKERIKKIFISYFCTQNELFKELFFFLF